MTFAHLNSASDKLGALRAQSEFFTLCGL